jgi:hypothetical protein
MKPIIDYKNGIVSVYLEFDMNQFNISKRRLNNRRQFFRIIEECNNQIEMNYINCLLLDILEDQYRTYKIKKVRRYSRLDNRHYIDWIDSRERQDISYNSLPNNIIKLGSQYINFNKGIISEDTIINKNNCNGGLILDRTNYNWIEGMIYYTYFNKKIIKDDIYNSKGNLILCSSHMVDIWKTKIESIWRQYNKVPNIVSISNRRKHSNVSYNDLVNSDYIILNYEYLGSKQYNELLLDYRLNDNIGYDEILQIIRGDLYNDLTIQRPIISIIKWNRLIIGSECSNKILTNERLLEIIFRIKSNNIWINLSAIPIIRNDILIFIRILLENRLLKLPLYDNNNKTVNMKEILYKLENTINVDINKTIIKVEPLEYENIILSHHGSNILDKVFNNITEEDRLMDRCSICYDNINIPCKLKCNHTYCLKCITMNMNYNSRCPICRTDIRYSDMSIQLNNKESSLLSRLDSLLSDISSSVIIYASSIIGMNNINKYLLDKGRTNIINLIGSNKIKRKLIEDHNNNKDNNIILINRRDSVYSITIDKVDTIITIGNEEIDDMSYGMRYIKSRIERLNLYVLVYHS